uniref:Uncharacterized protein n=1 Tax=Panagrolaimus sp. JU765 TaxID=591449 RepID=A0AC34QI98_9BILA
MSPNCYYECRFETVRVTGLLSGNVFAEIRSFKEVGHECYPDPVKRSNVIRKNLPRVNFLNSDFVLKRRFYEICFPVIRRKLWLSSTTTGNLGKKPTTYLAKWIKLSHAFENYDMEILTVDNIVFETKGFAVFDCANPNDVIHLNRHIEFNNMYFFAEYSLLNMEDLSVVCNQNGFQVILKNTNIQFSTLLELLPNLSWITYYDKLDEGWENDLWCRRSTLKFVYICPKKITNFKILADLCRNGMEIHIVNDNVKYDEDELQEYFQMSSTSLDGFLSISSLRCYLKDPKTIE